MIRKIFLCLPFFDKLLRCYRQCLGRESHWWWVLSEGEERSFIKKREDGGGMFIKNRNLVFIFLGCSIIKKNESG